MTAEDNQVVGRGTDRTNHGQYWTSDSPALLHVGTWLDIIQRMRPEGGLTTQSAIRWVWQALAGYSVLQGTTGLAFVPRRGGPEPSREGGLYLPPHAQRSARSGEAGTIFMAWNGKN
ncbi:hypothetical protein J7T55_014271 [Diaporthe amygdali]|uniref:uncharacterized protein n=1 Tax=Phomopsis amygdali TaxID=1214568 RepID=UPI0022FEC95D|nr:uncharacterized protein J7T55_014271 [Diaporthe amygdali]KAJ0109709.1 hypothetical protein J7T55_014271 [Diaporthe amygdali]